MQCERLIRNTITDLTGEEPEITIKEDDLGAIFYVNISGNIRALIGKQGKTIQALMTLAKAIGYNGKHMVKIVTYEKDKNVST